MNRTSPPCHVVSFLPIQVTVAPVIVVASIKPGSPLCNSHLPCIRRPVAMVERGVRRGRATTRKGGRSETYTGVSATEQDNLRPAPRRLASVVVVYVGAAAALFGWLEGWSFLDALYFSVVTCSTVGYGDILVKRSVSKLFVSCYALLSCGLLGGLLAGVVDRLMARQYLVVRRLQERVAVARLQEAVGLVKAETPDLVAVTEGEVVETQRRFYTSLAALLTVAIVGGFVFGLLQGLSIVDTLYLVVATLTTVGFGDHHPKTWPGKLFATIWLVLGTAGLANVISRWSDLRQRQREANEAKTLMSSRMSNEIYESIDTNHDGRLSEIEYLTFVLERIGKSTAQEVESIRKRFRELDQDGNGSITKDEVGLR